jgi:hypothetical protein
MLTRTLAAVVSIIALTGAVMAQTPEWRAFYPLKVGNRWTYVASDAPGNADPKKKDVPRKKEGDLNKRVVVEVERAEDFIRKVVKGENAVEEKIPAFILKSSSGDKVTRDLVAVREDGVHRILLNSAPIEPPLLFFKFGLKKIGETWEVDSKSRTTTLRGTYTITTGTVQVPYKNRATLDALIVAFSNNKSGTERHEMTWWYVREVGMVKHHLKVNNHESVLELEEFAAAK